MFFYAFNYVCAAKAHGSANCKTFIFWRRIIREIFAVDIDFFAEVDFVFADSQDIYPLEVKAGENLQARSLRVYRERYAPRLAIRTSLSNLRLDDGLLNVPLFALFNLESYLR